MSIDAVTIDFSKHLYTIITGDNASGKSSLLEAISMALIERRKGNSYRDYVQTGKKKAKIDMNVVLEGKDMRIVIEINNNKWGVPVQRTIYLGKEIFKNSDCTKLLKTFNVKYLQHITFFHQKDSSILELKPAEVSALLKELFKINYTSQASALSKHITGMEQSTISVESKIDTMQTFLTSLAEVPLLDDPNPAIAQLSKNIADKKKLIEQHADIKDKAQETAQLISELEAIEADEKSTTYQKERQEDGITSDVARIENTESRIEDATRTAAQKIDSSKVEELRSQIKIHQEKMQNNRDLLPEWKAKRANTQKEIEAYSQGICPVCEHDLTTESPTKLPSLEKRVSDYVKQIAEIEKHNLVIAEELKSLNTRLHVAEEEHLTLKSIIDKAAYIKPQLVKELHDLKKNLPLKETYVAEASQKIESLKIAKKQLTEKLSLLQSMQSEINIVKTLMLDLQSMQDSMETLQRNKVINEERKKNNKSVVETRKEQIVEIDEAKKMLNSLHKKINSSKEALNILIVDFPNYVILQKTAQLEDSINDIIQRIFPNMIVRLTLKGAGISFYYSPNGDKNYLPAMMASGAQGSVLMLAWRVALAEMYGIDTLILDEIDSDANDANSSIIYEFIGSLTMFDQIILISHRQASIKTVKDLNENVQSFWVEDGKYLDGNLH